MQSVIFKHRDQIRKVMGVCPQHDLLWDEMTGREHIEFFCRFKGVPEDLISAEVEHRLKVIILVNILFTNFRNYHS